jgi:glycosyltransferase involved in cell wall biosynthesis
MLLGSITLLTNIPAPYRIPTFNHLARLAPDDFRVVFCAPTEPGRHWAFPAKEMDFEWKLLSERSGATGLLVGLRSAAKMALYLTGWRPSAVICGGYDSLAAWTAFLWCKVFRRHFALWVESTARDRRPRGISGLLRTRLKRLMISQADAMAASGQGSADYMRALGARPRRVFIAPFSGDPAAFAREAAKVNASKEKQKRGFPRRLILYSGRLVRAKGVFVLLEAFRKLSQILPDAGLLVGGHGPEKGAMQEFCRSAHLDRVFFEGPQEYKRMPYYYALADVLALPTFSDPWGFVVNEAFACGVPAVVSRVAGACDDLIVEGQTGFAVEPGDADELAERIAQILQDDSLRFRMGANCRKLIEHYSAEACARGLLAAVRSCQPSAVSHQQTTISTLNPSWADSRLVLARTEEYRGKAENGNVQS